jgi:hypothetical protein
MQKELQQLWVAEVERKLLASAGFDDPALDATAKPNALVVRAGTNAATCSIKAKHGGLESPHWI